MRMFKKGRGRPRSYRPEFDLGTPELQQKRKARLKAAEPDDIRLAESLLGLLFVHNIITQPQYEAGCQFQAMAYQYETCMDQSFRTRASAFLRMPSYSQGYVSLTSGEKKKTVQWREAQRALEVQGTLPYQVVMRVVFYDNDLQVSKIPASNARESRALQRGLESLHNYFNKGKKGKRGTVSGQVLNLARSTRTLPSPKESQPYDPA